MTDTAMYTEEWHTLPWDKYQRNVFRLQQRIYRAERRGDPKQVHNLQRLLLRSWSARCLAVRRVTQDNRGKRTPGVDGVASLDPPFRLQLAKGLRHLAHWTTDPIRRTYIPKANKGEYRPLGIATLRDRAMQTLVKLALEPEWEARFEPNSYGFRPGRSIHDAIEAIFKRIHRKPRAALDADIAACFDKIAHQPLLEKLNTIQPVDRLVRQWLKAGILDKDNFSFPEAGVPQGGSVSPLLANIALHGMEAALVNNYPPRGQPAVIRYADDWVALHENQTTLIELKSQAETWLAEIGLTLNLNKTRLTHTLNESQGQAGFDFLGFSIRQYRVGKYRTRTYSGKAGFKTLIKPSKKATQRHLHKVRQIIRQYRGAPQSALIAALNPVIRGWANNYRTCVAKKAFYRLDYVVDHMLLKWATYRHWHKTRWWCRNRYWQRKDGRLVFTDGRYVLAHYGDTPIVRHVKVRGNKSPFDGDWLYWASRLGRDPTKPKQVVRLLKQQQGKCARCGLCFMTEDVMEVHHIDGNRQNYRSDNLALLHGHCHDKVHGQGANDKVPYDRGAV